VSSILVKVRDYGRMVRFSHSLFALPFALASVAFASLTSPVTAWIFIWVVIAMIAARNAAMGFNRLADAAIDARNPRTAAREIPRGVLRRGEVAAFVVLLSAIFVLAAGMLNRTCLLLSPLALAIVFFYSYTKRFLWASQIALGLSLAIAPVGAWIAVTGGIAWPPVLLGAAVLCWVAGFDIIYALQDVAFDREQQLRSLPEKFGVNRALWISRICHLLTICFLTYGGWLVGTGALFFVGVGFAACLLAYEQSLVKPNDLSRINLAFFTLNGFVSIGLFVFALLDQLFRI